MKTKEVETNREILGAKSREKMWDQFPDTFGETLFSIFEILKTRVFQISDRLTGPINMFWKK